METVRILWADDELDFLKSHLAYLNDKGYEVECVSNGQSVLDKISNSHYDLIFLDETMPGLSGLETLLEIKKIKPSIPVVLITKNEEDDLMEDAIGSQIADYLIKPVKPQQIISTIKKLTSNKKLISEKTNKIYQSQFQDIFSKIQSVNHFNDWKDLYRNLIYWELELENSQNKEMIEVFEAQKKDANNEFIKFVSKNYLNWMKNKDENTPIFSFDLLKNKVFDIVEENSTTFFILLDNLRFDQWKIIKTYINTMFIEKEEDLFLSVLPTTTQYSRNAIFAGMSALDIYKKYPQYWVFDDEENGKNNFEKELLDINIKNNFKSNIKFSYNKILKQEEGKDLVNNLSNLMNNQFNAIVYNFIDLLSHTRTEMEIMKELAKDSKAFRSLTVTWFEHSSLFELLKKLSTQKNINIVFATDHGTTQVKKPSKCIGDKQTSTNLRYKAGKNLQFNNKDVLEFKNPNDIKLPINNLSTSYIFAKDDNYLIYQNNYNYYSNYFLNSFQHGGISIEEMLIPISIYQSKN